MKKECGEGRWEKNVEKEVEKEHKERMWRKVEKQCGERT